MPSSSDARRASPATRPRIDERERRLAAAGFADEAEALAGAQLEIDAVDRVQHARAAAETEEVPPTMEIDRQILDLEQASVARAQP